MPLNKKIKKLMLYESFFLYYIALTGSEPKDEITSGRTWNQQVDDQKNKQCMGVIPETLEKCVSVSHGQ